MSLKQRLHRIEEQAGLGAAFMDIRVFDPATYNPADHPLTGIEPRRQVVKVYLGIAGIKPMRPGYEW